MYLKEALAYLRMSRQQLNYYVKIGKIKTRKQGKKTNIYNLNDVISLKQELDYKKAKVESDKAKHYSVYFE